jgi:hypothetical protein
MNLTLVCEGAGPTAFSLSIVGGTSGCLLSQTIFVEQQTAKCNPLFLKFKGFVINEQFPGSCGTCDGFMFDVVITP